MTRFHTVNWRSSVFFVSHIWTAKSDRFIHYTSKHISEHGTFLSFFCKHLNFFTQTTIPWTHIAVLCLLFLNVSSQYPFSPFFIVTEPSFYLDQHDTQFKDDFPRYLQLAVPSDMYLQDFAWEFDRNLLKGGWSVRRWTFSPGPRLAPATRNKSMGTTCHSSWADNKWPRSLLADPALRPALILCESRRNTCICLTHFYFTILWLAAKCSS